MSVPLTDWEGEPVETWKSLWAVPLVEAYAAIGSTSDRALELAAGGAGPYTVVVADEQTRGRGRRGTPWHSAPGSGLWMSVVLPSQGGAPWLPLLVGLAVADAIEGLSRAAAVGIKWPNDLFLGDRKVGGILCESAAGVVVTGIGVNVRSPRDGFPDALSETATSLDMNGAQPLYASHLAGMILDRLKASLATGPSGLAETTLQELAARDLLAGRAVRTEEMGPGTARGIARDGALLLERPDGSRVSVSSGSVRIV